jgi:adenine phosphoribosyltransferase
VSLDLQSLTTTPTVGGESHHATSGLLSSQQRSCNIDTDAIADSNDIGSNSRIMHASKRTYEQDGDEAREIAKHLPYYPFKGISKFYDIGGFLAKPDIFQEIVDIFVARYSGGGDHAIDSIAGLDARGFVLGPPIALALRVPFIMIRKEGKMPNTISSSEYDTEYGKRSGLTVQRDRIKKGDRVLIIDDLVATGGTLSSAITLVHALGGYVVECACVVELKMFIDPPEGSGLPSRKKLFESRGISHVPVWGLISEDVLTVEAALPEGYVDDGEGH